MLKNSKQKKIAILIAAVMILLSLFTLTGCGMQNPVQMAQEGMNQLQSTGTGEQNNGQISSNTQISNVIQPFDEQHEEALVTFTNDTNYYVINTEGKVVYSFSEPNVPSYASDSITYANGYILVDREISNYGEEDQRINYVKDLRDGSTKIEGTELIELVDITESGYVLQRVVVESLGGKTYESRIVDINGNIVWQKEDGYGIEYFATVLGDYVAYCEDSYSDNYKIIDVKNNKTIDLGFGCASGYFECIPFGNYLLTGISVNNDEYVIVNLNNFTKTNTGLSHVHKILNDKYVYATPLWGTVGIYTMDGELAKDLTEGEVEDIFYSNNTYYVISKTGYFYTLNDSFEYVKQPAKMLEDAYTGIDIGPNVTEFTKDSNIYYMPTNQFSPDQDMSTIATQGNLDEVNGKVSFLIQDSNRKLLNLETMQEITIQK